MKQSRYKRKKYCEKEPKKITGGKLFKRKQRGKGLFKEILKIKLFPFLKKKQKKPINN